MRWSSLINLYLEGIGKIITSLGGYCSLVVFLIWGGGEIA